MVTDDYDYEEAEFIREQAEVDRLNYKEAKAYIKSLGKESLLKEIRETDTYEGAFWHDGFGQDNPVFKILSDDFTSDREILIAILDTRFGWQNYAYASEALRSEKYILLKAIQKFILDHREGDAEEHSCPIVDATIEALHDVDIIKVAAKNNLFYVIKTFWSELMSDRGVILTAVKEDPHLIVYASDSLKMDRVIAFEVVEQNGMLFCELHKNLRDDKDILLVAIANSSESNIRLQGDLAPNDARKLSIDLPTHPMADASARLASDKEVALAAVKSSGHTLKYLSKELQGDKDIVLAAVNCYGLALEYADKKLQGDKDIVLAAVNNIANSLEFASSELKNDRDVALIAVSKDSWSFRFIGDILKNDKGVAEVAISTANRNAPGFAYITVICLASKEIQENKELVLKSAEGQSRIPNYAFRFSSLEIRSNPKIVAQVVEQSGYVLEYASDELRNDREIVNIAINQSGYALRYASDELRNDPLLVETAVCKDGKALEFASDKLRANRKIAIQAIDNDFNALEFVSSTLKQDKKFMREAELFRLD